MSPNIYHGHGWKKTHKKHRKHTGSVPWKKIRFNTGNFAKNAVLLGVALAIMGSLFILGVFAFVSRDLPDPNALTERTIAQSTKIYDRTGENLLYEIFGDQNRTLVKIQEGYCKDDTKLEHDPEGIPLYAIQATLAAEDRKFCSHKGFDITGIIRAVFANLRGRRQGASTLTQQLVKNAILSNEKTITRKAKELIISIELERRYSKDEILQIYFNEIPYGSTYYGIQSAAQNFFGKSVNELSLAEAATLAALPKAPTTYLNNPDRLQARRDWILDGMVEMDYISEKEAEQAKREDTSVEVNISNINAPHFVFFIKEQLEEKYGQRQVEEGGLKVITTLNWDLQQIAEEEVLKGVEDRGESLGFTNASLVAIDPKNGHIISMVGSKDYFDDEIDGQVNVSTRLRQPGSSFKPIVYTKAFEQGYTPNTVLWDVKTDFPSVTGTYSPNNYDLKERGPIRVRNAIQGSLNIPAVKMTYLVGTENALDFAEKLGYTSFEDRSRFGLSIVLGGGEVKLLEHVNAYGAFANKGVLHPYVGILKVEDANGQILEEWKETKGEKVIEENIAATITDVLADNNARTPFFGSASSLQLGSRPVAAKTGTTNDYHDAWTVGYTPSIAVGVWGGNNDNTAMNRGAGGSSVAAPIWNAFMRRALENQAVESFPKADIPLTGKAMLDGKLDQKQVFIDKISRKLATEYTPASQKEEVLFAQYHSLLHYVNRKDPLGSAPEKPEQDHYYDDWENAIINWIAREEEKTGVKITQSEPPAEFDDVHIPENFPTVKITNPTEGTEFDNRQISINLDGSAPRGISRVEFYIDGFFLGSDNRLPWNLDTTIPNTISRGYHTIKTVAYDDADNSGSDTIGIRVTSEATAAGLEIIDPKNGQTIEKTSKEFTTVISLKQPNNYQSVTVYAEPIGVGDKQIVGAKINPTSPFLTFSWGLPESGDWVLTATAKPNQGGNEIRTAGIVVHVVDVGVAPLADLVNGESEEETETPLPDLNPFAGAESSEE